MSKKKDKKLKFSTSDIAKYKANEIARSTYGRARKIESKKRKYMKKKSDWYYKGY